MLNNPQMTQITWIMQGGKDPQITRIIWIMQRENDPQMTQITRMDTDL